MSDSPHQVRTPPPARVKSPPPSRRAPWAHPLPPLAAASFQSRHTPTVARAADCSAPPMLTATTPPPHTRHSIHRCSARASSSDMPDSASMGDGQLVRALAHRTIHSLLESAVGREGRLSAWPRIRLTDPRLVCRVAQSPRSSRTTPAPSGCRARSVRPPMSSVPRCVCR